MPAPRVEALVARLEKGGRKSHQILSRLSPEEWDTIVYAEPYGWTMRDLLAHFVSAEERLLALAQNVAAGGPGAPEGFDIDAFNAEEHRRLAAQPPLNLLAALGEARQRTLDWVSTLHEAQLDRMGRHPALGLISLEAMITAIYGHQLLHMRDLQARLG